MHNFKSVFSLEGGAHAFQRTNTQIKLKSSKILASNRFGFTINNKNDQIREIFAILTTEKLFLLKKQVDINQKTLTIDVWLQSELRWTLVYPSNTPMLAKQARLYGITFMKGEECFSLFTSSERIQLNWLGYLVSLTLQTSLFDKYDVKEYIKDDNVFKVYKAVERKSGRLCTCKRIQKADLTSKKAYQMLVNEIRVLSRIKLHSEFVQLKEVHETSNSVFLVIDLSSCCNLFQLPSRKSSHEISTLAEYLLKALSKLQQSGIAHNDLKPTNVMLVSKNKGLAIGNLKLIGFKYSTETRDRGSASNKTPHVDSRTLINDHYRSYNYTNDIYNAGAILYNSSMGYEFLNYMEGSKLVDFNSAHGINFNTKGFLSLSSNRNLKSAKPDQNHA